MAGLAFHAVNEGVDRVSVSYDPDTELLHSRVGRVTRAERYPGRVDRIRNGQTADEVAAVAVHEAGHAVAYGREFGLAPLQLHARSAAADTAGFTMAHSIYGTADSLLGQARVALAGGIAEEVVFGPGLASVGRVSDRARATRLVIDYVRQHGFTTRYQGHYMLGDGYDLSRRASDVEIEALISELAVETRRALLLDRPALVGLARALAEQGALSGEEVRFILARHGIEVAVRAKVTAVCRRTHICSRSPSPTRTAHPSIATEKAPTVTAIRP